MADATYTSYTSSATAGFCTVTATESAHGTSNSTVVTQTAAVAATTFHTSVSAVPATVTTDGSITSTITATVLGAGNAPVPGDQVELTVAGTSAACGTFKGSKTFFGTTNSSGQVPAIYTDAGAVPAATPGACVITATEADQGTSGTATVTQVLAGYTVTASASPATIVANGTSTSAVAATVLQNGADAAGISVLFTATPAFPAGVCGTLPATPVVTDAAGVTPTVTYSSSTIPGFCTITATAAAVGGVGTVALDQTSTTSTATAVSVNANPSTINVGGTSTVSATVTGAAGTAIIGDQVHFTMSGTACPTGGTATLKPANGVTPATTTFTAGRVAGSCTVTATEAFSGQSGSTTITVLPLTYTVKVAASPSAITGNGVTTSQVTATVTNTAGAAAAGDSDTFVVTPAVPGTTCGSVGAGAVFADGAGQATITYTSSANAGSAR